MQYKIDDKTTDSGVTNENDNNYIDNDNSISKSGVGVHVNDSSSNLEVYGEFTN